MPMRSAQRAAQTLIQGLQQLPTIQFTAGVRELKPVRAQRSIHLLRQAASSVGKLPQMHAVIVVGQKTIEIQQ